VFARFGVSVPVVLRDICAISEVFVAWGAYRAKAESTAASHFYSRWSVRRKLMVSLIPSILFILVVAGYATNWYSSRYLTQALQRTAQVQNLSQAREMEQHRPGDDRRDEGTALERVL